MFLCRCVCVRLQLPLNHQMGFHKISYWRVSLNSVDLSQFWFKSDESNDSLHDLHEFYAHFKLNLHLYSKIFIGAKKEV
jgi:hypothetical protein